LCKLIASLHDENNRITVKGFYDDVEAVSKQERNELSRAPFNIEAYKHAIDIPGIWGEKGYTPSERTGIRPSLDVNGIWGGYTAEGTKTIIPSQAHAKISVRLVPNQDHFRIAELFAKHFEENTPDYVRVSTQLHHGGYGYVTPLDHIGYKAAVHALEKVYGVTPVPVRSGGSIPVISNFDKVLGIKSILMGFGLQENAIHSPNESFPIDQFFKGIEAIIEFYQQYVRNAKSAS
jgi:acetylornithine deacetylase/succinyl-diaminopimelate desuccinylase-like protein